MRRALSFRDFDWPLLGMVLILTVLFFRIITRKA